MKDLQSEIQLPLSINAIFGMREISCLNVQQQKRLRKNNVSFSNKQREREYVCARQLLRDMTRQKLQNVQSISFKKNEKGKPFLEADQKRYEISIVHTKKWVFCGLSLGPPIGVDLEPVSRKVSKRLRKRMEHPAEKGGGLDIDTLRMWTIKESYIKRCGQVLRLNMNEVYITVYCDKYSATSNNDISVQICSFQHQQHWMAIAY